jgi:hypothetical protein
MEEELDFDYEPYYPTEEEWDEIQRQIDEDTGFVDLDAYVKQIENAPVKKYEEETRYIFVTYDHPNGKMYWVEGGVPVFDASKATIYHPSHLKNKKWRPDEAQGKYNWKREEVKVRKKEKTNMGKVRGAVQVVGEEEADKFIGNKVCACNICGLIALAEKGENIEEITCVECGNIDWEILGQLAKAEKEVEEEGVESLDEPPLMEANPDVTLFEEDDIVM